MRIEIGLAAEHNYSCGLLVTAASMAIYANREDILSFNILDYGMLEQDIVDLRERLPLLHPHVEIHIFPITATAFEGFPLWRGNWMAYARFLLPDLLPNASHIIYSDVDVVWCADVSELWRLRSAKVAFQGVFDVGFAQEATQQIYDKYDLPYDPGSYLNSGVIIMNLERFRTTGFLGVVSEFLRDHNKLLFGDQDALNIIWRNEKSSLPQCWMRFTYSICGSDIEVPIVLHYSEDLPWLRKKSIQSLTDANLVWHRINAKARGMSVWGSLRQHFSIPTIILKRGLFLLTSQKWIRSMLAIPCQLVGKSGYIRYFEQWSKRLPIDKLIKVT